MLFCWWCCVTQISQLIMDSIIFAGGTKVSLVIMAYTSFAGNSLHNVKPQTKQSRQGRQIERRIKRSLTTGFIFSSTALYKREQKN